MNAKEAKKEIIKDIERLSGAKSQYEVFYDWITAMAMMYANLRGNIIGPENLNENDRKIYDEREKLYEEAVGGYENGTETFARMHAMLVVALEDDMTDMLGEIFMEAGIGNKSTGQFFSPFHLSLLTAKLNVSSINIPPDKKISINEPSCGAGGMIIGAAAALKEKGIDYQVFLDVVAQDLDWKAVYAAYVQLSILGIKAIVVQGNTLMEPYTRQKYRRTAREFVTPAKEGMLIY